mgnify:CR=1 FL=1
MNFAYTPQNIKEYTGNTQNPIAPLPTTSTSQPASHGSGDPRSALSSVSLSLSVDQDLTLAFIHL